MSVQLLDKTRKINKLLHNNNSSKVSGVKFKSSAPGRCKRTFFKGPISLFTLITKKSNTFLKYSNYVFIKYYRQFLKN